MLRSTPHKYTGRRIDPVSHSWFLPNVDSPRRDAAVDILLFASVNTLDRFLEDTEPCAGHTPQPLSVSTLGGLTAGKLRYTR
jgi:hypothetical protein